jgi:hypothetical protein
MLFGTLIWTELLGYKEHRVYLDSAVHQAQLAHRAQAEHRVYLVSLE